MKKTDYTEIEDWLRTNLTNERFEHSFGTAECAAELAEKYGLDKERAYFAGLIHDCAKCLSESEMKNILNKVNLTDGEINNPKTYHAPAGAYLARELFHVEDEEILSAVRWHTLGKIDMTLFEKIIFLADKLESRTRPASYTKPISKELEKSLDRAIFVCYRNTIKSLADRNLSICSATIDIYNKLLSELQ